MMVRRKMVVLAMVVLVTRIGTIQMVVAGDGDDIPSCVMEMYACHDHKVLGGVKQRPSSECCASFAAVVEDQLPCVCSVLMNSNSSFAGFIDVAQATALPASCNLNWASDICTYFNEEEDEDEPLLSRNLLLSTNNDYGYAPSPAWGEDDGYIPNGNDYGYAPSPAPGEDDGNGYYPEVGGGGLSKAEIVGIVIAVNVSLFLVFFLVQLYLRRRRVGAPPAVATQPQPNVEGGRTEVTEESTQVSTTSETRRSKGAGSDQLTSTMSLFSLEDLEMATKGFSKKNLLGQGGFGDVHKGVLPNGREVAIKQLRLGSRQGEREFKAEVETIDRVHHRHLVSLVGYCIQEERRLLVYEFVPNGTLASHLHSTGRPPMEWSNRMKVALGSAKGLAYLHEDCIPRIIHRDVKAPNILVDYNFEAKVADFGLAKIAAEFETHVSTRIMGTIGYLAPEYASTGKLTEKSDVFSYGVILLELITGKRPVITMQDRTESLVDWVNPYLIRAIESKNYEEIVDPRLEHNYDDDEMSRLVECAAACIRRSARRRPKMSQVVRVIEGGVSMDELHQGVRPGHTGMYSASSPRSSESGEYVGRHGRSFGIRQGSSDYSPSDSSMAFSGEGRRS